LQLALAATNKATFPDWSGECAAIVASGPSANAAQVGLLKGRLSVIAIKKSVELCPWADVVYGCDAAWWRSVRGLPEFKGLKLAWDAHVCGEFPNIHRVWIDEPKESGDVIVTDQIGHVGAGGTSGFQALNLAVQFGAKRILLIGFDMTDRPGVHWYGRNNWPGGNNPGELNFRRWIKAFANAVPTLASLGVEVVNGSPVSQLRTWPKASVEETLAAWGL
jgi:hypothetical protein